RLLPANDSECPLHSAPLERGRTRARAPAARDSPISGGISDPTVSPARCCRPEDESSPLRTRCSAPTEACWRPDSARRSALRNFELAVAGGLHFLVVQLLDVRSRVRLQDLT